LEDKLATSKEYAMNKPHQEGIFPNGNQNISDNVQAYILKNPNNRVNEKRSINYIEADFKRAQQQAEMNSSSCSRLRQDCVCVAGR